MAAARPLNPPVPVRVWIPRARHGWVQLDGTANAYTAKAAHVEYLDEHGRTGHAWVWASCVECVGLHAHSGEVRRSTRRPPTSGEVRAGRVGRGARADRQRPRGAGTLH
jgi:hypothetical protein